MKGGCRRGLRSSSTLFARFRCHRVDAFRKDGEDVTFQPRDGVIEREDAGTVRGLNGDLGGVKHVEEAFVIRVDVKAAIVGAHVEGRRAPGKDAAGRSTQSD